MSLRKRTALLIAPFAEAHWCECHCQDIPTFMTHQADQSIFSLLFKRGSPACCRLGRRFLGWSSPGAGSRAGPANPHFRNTSGPPLSVSRLTAGGVGGFEILGSALEIFESKSTVQHS